MSERAGDAGEVGLTDDWWVSPYNSEPEVREGWRLPSRVEVHDVTLREAEQGCPITFSVDERVRLAEGLAEAGVRRIEIMPAVSEGHLESIRRISDLNLGLEIHALCRFKESEMARAIDAGATHVGALTASINPWVIEHVIGMSPDAYFDRVIEMLQFIRSQGAKAFAGAGDVFRTPEPVAEAFYKRVVSEGQADGVKVNDSFGFSLPWAVQWFVSKVRSWVPADTPIQMHVHNDFGLATASTLAGVAAGADVVDVAVNGYGERGGNSALEEVVLALEVLMGVETGVELSDLYRLSTLAAEIAKVPLPADKPVVGENLHTLWTGLHADWRSRGMEAGRPSAWSPFSPQLIGKPGYQIKVGAMAGRHLVQLRLRELGVELTDEQARVVRDRAKAESRVRKGALTDEVVLDIARDVLARSAPAGGPDRGATQW